MNNFKESLRKSALYGPKMRSLVTKVKSHLGNEAARNNHLAFNVMKRVIDPCSNCVDVGCHNGLYMDQILQLAPDGTHYAFEVLPHLVDFLRVRYRAYSNVHVHDEALSNQSGMKEFHFNKKNPGYSGFKLRSKEYPDENDEVQVLQVTTERLDSVVPKETRLDFVKLDVEGAELTVLEGGYEMLRRDQPLVIFEYGIGAADYFEAWPEKVFELLKSAGLFVCPIEKFVLDPEPINAKTFGEYFNKKLSYYFVAFSEAHQSRINNHA